MSQATVANPEKKRKASIPSIRWDALTATRAVRSVANIYHAYAVHSFLDELAAAANRDRVEYLLAALGTPRVIELRPAAQQNRPNPFPIDTARTRRVVELVAEQYGWAKKKPSKGSALGIAVHRSFNSYVATVVEVQVDPAGKITIPNVWTAADCGKIINPDRVKALDQWSKDFPDTEVWQAREESYLTVYGQMKDKESLVSVLDDVRDDLKRIHGRRVA